MNAPADQESLQRNLEPTLASTVKQSLRISILATVVLGVIVSGIYPLIVWSLANVFFPSAAAGSLIRDKSGVVIGSVLIGQNFSAAWYFHPRPSSAGYDATASGASNLGPTSAKLINGTTKKDDKGVEVVDFDGIHDRIVHYCDDNGIAFDSSLPIAGFKDAQGNFDDVKLIKAFNADPPLVITPRVAIPADAVTMSGSGLDPHISVENANMQAQRVAIARKIPLEKVKGLIDSNTEGPQLGIFGERTVNVLKLNLALDATAPVSTSTAPATQPAGK